MLIIHRAERADRLVDALGAVLAEPLDDALATEVVAVPTRGVERWLAQRLAGRLGVAPGRADGVCANVDFPFPSRLIGGLVARASGVDPAADPWLPERAVWPLLEVVDAAIGEPWLQVLASHLGAPDGARHGRRFGTLRHLADLFERYAVHRPAMVRAWAGGADVDATGAPLPHDVAWQAQLWRRLRDRIGVPSLAERFEGASARLAAEPTLAPLPPRLALFGLTRLPASALDVLAALAVARTVHLFLLHPSPVLWERIAAGDAVPSAPLPRTADTTADQARNPLLATWGRDAREMQVVLAGGASGSAADLAAPVVAHHPLDEAPRTLLQRIQADVRADRVPGSDGPVPLLDPTDRSLQIHACHGRDRQVEVVRDAILQLLADHPTLEPRDVIVMCPDIDAFAPLITATFGVGGELEDGQVADLPDLRVRLADRSLRQSNPVLGVVAEVLGLAAARVTASQVVDLASREPVRRRFRLDDDDLARLEDWVAATGVRWGLDAAHRAPFKLDAVGAGTWRAGVDRLLLGVARSEEDLRLFAGVLPLDDVDSADIDLAGRAAELLERLAAALAALAGPQPVADWVAALAASADALTAADPREPWQREELQRLLDEVRDEAGSNTTALELAEVQALLADRLRGQPTRANFRTGHLTMCTLVPMRSVPHRVVCLLGLDDGVFPRKTAPDGDDLLALAPCVGDRDARSEDRQLLLDALLAATDHLVITYAGRDERTNAARPPAVPIGELLDVVDRTVATDAVDDAGNSKLPRDVVVVEHPLQPFSERCFRPGALLGDGAWSFDAVALEGAQAAAGPRMAPAMFLADPLPPSRSDVLELEDLVKFVQHPVRAFLRQRLGTSVADRGDDLADGLSVELDSLEEWGLGERLLAARLAGLDAGACREAEIARGTLPPGELARGVIDRIGPVVDAITAEALAATPPDTSAGSLEVAVTLADGRLLVGTVPELFGDVLRPVTYSRLSARHRLTAWVRLLALTAARPERPFAAAVVGRRNRTDGATRRLAPLAADADGRRHAALEQLAVLVDLHDRGLREPLPIACKTSCAYAEAQHRGHDAVAAARKEWLSDWDFPKEDRELEHQLVRGGVATLEEVLAEPPRDDEQGDGWAVAEASRFGRYAGRLWAGLLAHERVRQW